jgi:hypothetical protein
MVDAGWPQITAMQTAADGPHDVGSGEFRDQKKSVRNYAREHESSRPPNFVMAELQCTTKFEINYKQASDRCW